MFTSPGLTSVAISSVNNFTVVFLGTANGRLLKVKVAEYQRVRPPETHGFTISDRIWHLVPLKPLVIRNYTGSI